MKEILVMGNISEDFKRLGIEVRKTYDGEDYGVCEVIEEEFKILCDEPDIEGTWKDGGWRHCEGSNQGVPSDVTLINGKGLKVWLKKYEDEDEDEEDEEEYVMTYSNLLEYMYDEVGASQPKNVCALAKDLAKYNGIKMSELFREYQG